MSGTLDAIRKLAAEGDLRISDHGYEAIAEDRIPVRDIISGVDGAVVVEDYPDFGMSPAVLVLQYDQNGEPVHVVWGIPKGHSRPAVLVTAYRPDPQRWSADFLERRDEQT